MSTVNFSPQLYIPGGTTDIGYYSIALGAILLRQWKNDDGSIHVAEFSVGGQVFQVHEESLRLRLFDPEKLNGSTVIIGLFVDEVDEWMRRAIDAGAVEISPAQDYDYGYRQGQVRDPFGHLWMFEQKIG